MVGGDKINFPHKLFLTKRLVESLHKAFANKSASDIKFSNTQLSKIIRLGGFLGWFLGPLLKTILPLMKNVIKTLAKGVLIPLLLTGAALTTLAAMHKKIPCHKKLKIITKTAIKIYDICIIIYIIIYNI